MSEVPLYKRNPTLRVLSIARPLQVASLCLDLPTPVPSTLNLTTETLDPESLILDPDRKAESLDRIESGHGTGGS